LLTVGGVFEKWLDSFFEVDTALRAFEEENGVFIGQASEELGSVGGLGERGDGAAISNAL